MINESKLINLLFEGNENLVVKNGDRFHLEDYIQYFNKPGIIVATIKGDSECGIQQLPVGAVDNFRFMQVTNEEAITEQEKNNGKTYDQILKEYEGEKCRVLDQWKKLNMGKYNDLKTKYGDKFLGMDITENKKKIDVKNDEEENDGMIDKKDEGRDKERLEEIDTVQNDNDGEQLEEGLMGNFISGLKNWWTQNKDASKKITDYFNKHQDVMKTVSKGIAKIKNELITNDKEKAKAYDSVFLGAIIPNEQIKESKNDKGYGIDKKTITKMDVGGKTYICFNATLSDNESATLKDLYDVLKKNNINKLSEDITGMIVFDTNTKTDIRNKNKQNIAINNGYPVIEMYPQESKAMLKCDFVTINKSAENDIDNVLS